MSEYTPLWADKYQPEPEVVPEPQKSKKNPGDFLYAPLNWAEGHPILEVLLIPLYILMLPLWMAEYAIADWKDPIQSGPKRNNSLEMP